MNTNLTIATKISQAISYAKVGSKAFSDDGLEVVMNSRADNLNKATLKDFDTKTFAYLLKRHLLKDETAKGVCFVGSCSKGKETVSRVYEKNEIG